MTVYLDYNATAPLLPAVRVKMNEIMDIPLNGSSVHAYGQYARRLIQSSRRSLGKFIDANFEDIIFTSGGTEANNLALHGSQWDNIFVSAIEHDSVYKVYSNAHHIPVNSSGIVDLNVLEELLKFHQGRHNLVSIMAANNETGVIQPISEIVDIAHRYNAYVHTDAIQIMGKRSISFIASHVDMMTVSFHKVGGPQGVGGLIVNPRISLTPMLRGGGQEKGKRSGTENVIAIAGLEAAIENLPCLDHLAAWHHHLENTISRHVRDIPGFHIFSRHADRLPNVTSISMPTMANGTQVMAFDLKGFAVSAGSACSSGTVKISRILMAMGAESSIGQNTIRVSSGWNTKQSDLESFANTWIKMFNDSLPNERNKERSMAS